MKKSKRRTGLTARFGQAQANAERALGRGYDATLQILPPRSRKAVQQLASQIGATAEDVGARGRQVLRAVSKQRQVLQDRLEQGVRRVGRRGERARAALETRGTRLIGTIERQAAAIVKPLVRRLDIAAASEVEQLRKRLAQLERKLATGGRRAAA